MTIFELTSTLWSLEDLLKCVEKGSDLDLTVEGTTAHKPLAVLAKLNNREGDLDIELVRASAKVQKHVHLAFFMVCEGDVRWYFLEHSCLEITTHTCHNYPDAYLLILSGTLNTWVYDVVNGLSPNNPRVVRTVYQELYQIICAKALGQVFSDYRQETYDKILYLERK